MRIRYPFAGAFSALVVISAYVGLSAQEIPAVNDKLLHLLDFFLLTLTLYWALELPRRVLLKLVLAVAIVLSIGSELLQAALPNGRDFDPIDIAANIIGSSLALVLCQWYHKRMLERRRRRKLQGYGLADPGEGENDLELGEGGSSGQELGVVAHNDSDDGGEAWDEIGGSDAAEGEIQAGKKSHEEAAD